MISVITPVFNAGRFLNKTIKSVLSQEEVTEYLLIDDGSTDNSWEIIKEWEKLDKRVIGLQHKNKKNLGRSITRNLGIKKATQKYIAFLDADDFYLDNRFVNDIKILESNINVDGVYNAIGVFYYDDYRGERLERLNLTTIKEPIESDELFEKMSPIGDKGWFSCDGLIVRKNVFNKAGFFNEKLIVAEDTELWCRMALKVNLISGLINKPVALRGVHNNNVFYKNNFYKKERLLMSQLLFNWAINNDISVNRLQLVWELRNKYFKINSPDRKGELKLMLKTFEEILYDPKLLKYRFIVKQPFVSFKRVLNLTFSKCFFVKSKV